MSTASSTKRWDAVTTSGEGTYWLASTGIDGVVRLWSPLAGREDGGGFTNPSSVWAMAVIPAPNRSSWLACGGVDGVIRLWDPVTGQEMGALRGHGNTVSAMSMVRGPGNAGQLASADVDGVIRLWDSVVGHEPPHTLEGHLNAVNAISAIPTSDGVDWLASGDGDGILRLWDVQRRHELKAWQGHTNLIWAVVAVPGPDGTAWLASAGVDGGVRLWELPSGRAVPVDFGHDGVVYDLAIVSTPDGNILLASACIDGQIGLWDPTSGRQQGALRGHEGPVRAVEAVYSEDGTAWLASGGGDGTVRLWDLATAEVSSTFHGHGGSVLAIAPLLLGQEPTLVEAEARSTIDEPSPIPGRVKTPGFGDRAASVDLLGRADLVEVIVDILGRSDESTADEESGPSVVSIEGPWGAGKTTTMQLVRVGLDLLYAQAYSQPRSRWRRLRLHLARRWRGRRLTVVEADWELRRRRLIDADRKQPSTPQSAASLPVTAWFNPWAHQSSEQVWAGLTREIINASRKVLYPEPDLAERYWFSRNLRRIDRRDVKRQLWRRITSPLLRASMLAVLIPLIAIVIAQQFDAKTPTFSLLGRNISPVALGLLLLASLLAAGVAHTTIRYMFSRASSFLPGELFRGPVLSSVASMADITGRLALRDPLYDAASGYLYLLQHDVREVLKDVESSGHQLVIFIDDLDRCTPKTTAEVFEAINLFLSESFPRARFVIGLDPVIVTAHIDRTYADLVGHRNPSYIGDPSPGWTFLRKLVQLPIALPKLTDDSVDRLLDVMLGTQLVHAPSSAGDISIEDGTKPESPWAGPVVPTASGREAEDLSVRTMPATQNIDAKLMATRAPADASNREDVTRKPDFALERHHQIRALLRERLARQPDQSARHTKRLLTIWQFYVRMLDRALPVTGDTAVRRARQLVVVAEIIARWPAQLRGLRRFTDGRSGVQLLAASHHDDIAWHRALESLGMADAGGDSLADLRELLATDDGRAAADLLTAVT